MEENTQKPKRQQFNILSGSSTQGHRGFGQGTLSLDNISPVIIDTESNETVVDMGALHAKSAVERRIKFTSNREDSANGKLYWLVWVAIERTLEGAYYAGVAACEMRVDEESRRGYKNLAEHVNNMDKAMKRKVVVSHMDQESKNILANFLREHSEEMWNLSSAELKEALA